MRSRLLLAIPAFAATLHAQNPLTAPPAPQGNGPATVPAAPAPQPDANAQPEFPPVQEVLKGYEKVVSTADGRKSFYTLWSRAKDQQLFAELPKEFASQRHYLALTVASGDDYAGLQAGDLYFYWKP